MLASFWITIMGASFSGLQGSLGAQVRLWSVSERSGDFARVVAEHVEIGWRRAGRAGKRVRVERAANDGAGFAGSCCTRRGSVMFSTNSARIPLSRIWRTSAATSPADGSLSVLRPTGA